MTHANNNFFIRTGEHSKGRLPDGWQHYAKVEMIGFGPIGIIKDGPQKGRFEYLDPENNARMTMQPPDTMVK